MEYVISENAKKNVVALCDKLSSLGWIMETSASKYIGCLGQQLIELADEITDEMNSCVPECAE